MKDDLKRFFLNTKPVELLVAVRRSRNDSYASKLSRRIDATYSHTVKVLKKLNDYGLVEFQTDGRKKVVVLTPEGDRLAEQCGGLLDEFEKVEESS